MRQNRFSLVALTLFFVAAALAAGPLGAQTVPNHLHQTIPTGRPDQALFDEAVLLFSNAARRHHGRAPLVGDPALAQAASDHAKNMARLKTHSHELPVRGQRDLSQRIKRRSVSFRLAAENIAMDKVYMLLGRPISAKFNGCNFRYGDTREPVPAHTYASLAQQVVSRWLASPGHKKNLLNRKYERIGSGIGVDPNGQACGDFYLVQNFAD
ncbi:MAG: CAP domain-containing protein [Pseudomonadota bacterium]